MNPFNCRIGFVRDLIRESLYRVVSIEGQIRQDIQSRVEIREVLVRLRLGLATDVRGADSRFPAMLVDAFSRFLTIQFG